MFQHHFFIIQHPSQLPKPFQSSTDPSTQSRSFRIKFAALPYANDKAGLFYHSGSPLVLILCYRKGRGVVFAPGMPKQVFRIKPGVSAAAKWDVKPVPVVSCLCSSACVCVLLWFALSFVDLLTFVSTMRVLRLELWREGVLRAFPTSWKCICCSMV